MLSESCNLGVGTRVVSMVGMTNTIPNSRHPLFLATLAADEAYHTAAHELFGDASVWLTRRQQQHPKLQAVQMARVKADTAWREWLRCSSMIKTHG